MHERIEGTGFGVIGGIAGLAAMQLGQRLTHPMIRQRAPAPTDVFATARSMSLIGVHHHPDENATNAIARIGYEKIFHREPPPRVKSILSWAVHIGYGLAAGGLYGALRPPARRRSLGTVLRSGALYGAALWLVGDELAMPLLGLSDKPTEYHPTRHLSSLVEHLAFGLATVATARLLWRIT